MGIDATVFSFGVKARGSFATLTRVSSLDWFIPGRLLTWDDAWGLDLVGVDGKVADFGTIEAGDMRSIIPVPAKEWVLLQEQGRLEAVPAGGPARPAIFVRALTPGAPPVFLRHTEYSGMPMHWSPDGEYLAAAEGEALDLYRP